jgi:predicted PurR-regulated permease PerM
MDPEHEMEQRRAEMEPGELNEKREGHGLANGLSEAAQNATRGEEGRDTVAAASDRAPARSRGLFSGVATRFQGARDSLRGSGRVSEKSIIELPAHAAELPAPAAELSAEDTTKIEDLVKWTRRLVTPLALLAWAAVVILVLWLAGHISRTLILFVIAALLAYALAPLVKFLERAMPRFLAILIVYLIVLGAVVGLLYLVVRTAVDQFASLSTNVQTLLSPASGGHVSPLEQTLATFGITQSQILAARDQLVSQSERLAGNVLPLLSGVFNSVLDVVVVAVLSIYLLIDGSRLVGWLRGNMPLRQRGRTRFLLETLQRIVGGYIRGQLLLCALVGVAVGAGMAILHVPYALLLGVLAFILEFIPVLGVLVSGAVCVLLALTQGWFWAVIVLAYFVVVHVLEGDVLGPRVVGKAVGLHPIVSLLAVIAGSELFGITGALLASPVAGVLQAFVITLWAEWREMHPKEFQDMKNQVADKVEKNVADRPVDPEPAARLLTDGE